MRPSYLLGEPRRPNRETTRSTTSGTASFRINLGPDDRDAAGDLAMSDQQDDFQRCPRCGAEYFHAEPGVTAEIEVRQFACKMGWATVAESGWLSPGDYCPNGCEGVGRLSSHRSDVTCTLYLDDPGPDRKALIVRLHQLLHLSLPAARSLLAAPRPQLIQGSLEEILAMVGAIRDLQPRVAIEPPSRLWAATPRDLAAEQSGLERLRDARLLVHDQGPRGYTIVKPASVPGNSRGYENSAHVAQGGGVAVDGPTAQLFPAYDKWWLEVHLCIPGPGPGDFHNDYPTLDNAVSAVLEYYFVDPSWMNPPERSEGFQRELCLKSCELVPGSRCKRSGCGSPRMRNSVFCPVHHFEALGEPAPKDL